MDQFNDSSLPAFPIVVRRATLVDAPVIGQYNAAMALETEHKHLDPDLLLAGVKGLFADEARGFYLVAEHDGNVVGQLMITFEWSDWRNGVFWWIQSVYVREEFRGKGVFRLLYEHASMRAREAGNVCGLRLYVEKENGRAKEVYRKLGMHATEYELWETEDVFRPR